MLNKMISVRPPHKGEAPDSKLAVSKDFRGTSKSDYKKDFEKALEKKLDQKKDDLESKNEVVRKEELRADKKDKKSLGGTKKKVTEDDDKMVSNVMASNESKVEIPDSKIENLAEIEVDIPEKNKVDVAAEAKAGSAGQLLTQLGLISNQIVMPEGMASKAADQLKQLETLSATEPLAPVEVDTPLTRAADSTATQDLVRQIDVPPSQIELPVPPQLQDKVQSKALDPQAELNADVGFVSDQNMQETSKGLLQKMKSFDVDKNLTSNKPQSFEQNVLSRLQNEQANNMKQVSEPNHSAENQSDLGKESSGQLKDLKSDLLDSNQLHQAAGQTHTEFKTQLSASSAAQSPSSAGNLEDNREANVSEIMKQAQYLVTKGGGEVSVKMSPEGLGELHLKVLFQDGKLNIEMQTQNKEVKKLVEDSLSELRSGLAAQRLSLEHVKIDTVGATNADNNTQFQSNLSHGGSQENAREYWRDFQGNMNNQSGRKNSYADSSGQSSVAPRSSSAGAASANQAMRTYGGTKGATVNRVA